MMLLEDGNLKNGSNDWYFNFAQQSKGGTGIFVSGGKMLIDKIVYGWKYSVIFLH